MSGRGSYLHGLAAEDAASRHYEDQGGQILARRARTPAGEIDLIAALGDVIIFVEVKARKKMDAGALSPRQMARIGAAAEIWLAEAGYPPATDMRFDVVLTDRMGGIEVIENALGFDL